MSCTEDSRVKTPTILRLVRLGYKYLFLTDAIWDIETNIFPGLFHKAIANINEGIESDDIGRLLDKVKSILDYEALGKAF